MVKINFKRREPSAGIILLTFGMFILILIGCGSLKFDTPKNNSPDIHSLELIKSGNDAFAQGEYETAAQIYESLYKKNQNSQIRQWTLYGLACTALITAETSLQHDAAVGLWKQWQQSVQETIFSEDPRLLGPYIQMNDSPCKKESEIRLLMNKNATLEEEIIKLKHQISSLEAIDQKIKEKKKEISSP